MILLCDEDVGTGIPTALRAVGYEANSLVGLGWGWWSDVDWLAKTGDRWLVFSYNKKMLLVQEERDAIISYNVGIVYLTNGTQYLPKVLKLLLTKWETLGLLHATEPRPFVRFLSPNGRLAQTYKHYHL